MRKKRKEKKNNENPTWQNLLKINLLDFLAPCLLGQDLSLKKDLEVSAYKRATKAKPQITIVIIEIGSFPLGGFIAADGEGAKLIAES